VAAQGHVVLAERQRVAGRDQDLPTDQIDAAAHLGHAVLDLQARVHLHEAQHPGPVAGLIQQKLPRARPRGVEARSRKRRVPGHSLFASGSWGSRSVTGSLRAPSPHEQQTSCAATPCKRDIAPFHQGTSTSVYTAAGSTLALSIHSMAPTQLTRPRTRDPRALLSWSSPATVVPMQDRVRRTANEGCMPSKTAVFVLSLLLALSSSCDKKDASVRPEREDRYDTWSFGVTESESWAISSARWDSNTPDYCKDPRDLLNQITSEVEREPRGCRRPKVADDDTGLYLRMTCTVTDDECHECPLVYKGTLEIIRGARSTKDYQLSAQGSVRRHCPRNKESFSADASTVTQVHNAALSVRNIISRCQGR
jgi:hypothetical protein